MELPIELSLIPFLGSFVINSCARSRSRSARSLRVTLVLVGLYGFIVLSPSLLLAQSSSAGQNPPGQPDGVTSGGYTIHSSVEFGYRSNDVTGSSDMYDTLVNQRTGPRILDQTLSMQSVDHQGPLFDDLYLNSFRW